MKKIAILGYGRFGELLAQLAKGTFDVAIMETDEQRSRQAARDGYAVIPAALLSNADFIFLAVPISSLESSLQALAPLATKDQVVVDLCSVKVYPVQLMQKYLSHCQLLASHPMFGPDSAQKGLDGMQVALCPLTIDSDNLAIIEDFWRQMGCEPIRTTANKHDYDNAYSLAFTHSIAKIIINSKLPDITFQTRSFNDVIEVASLSAKDTDQLFHDMLFYNPYFSQMKAQLEAATAQTLATLNTVELEQSASQLFDGDIKSAASPAR